MHHSWLRGEVLESRLLLAADDATYWAGGAGDWHEPESWGDHHRPTYGTDASIREGAASITGGFAEAATLSVGGSSDSPTLRQSGGVLTVYDPDFWIGKEAGETGTYELTNGELDVVACLHVGEVGAGHVYQTGGTARVRQTLRMSVQSGSQGYYTLDDGELTVGVIESIASEADFTTAVFRQNGGVNRAAILLVGASTSVSGSYQLSGGMLEAGWLIVGAWSRHDSPGPYQAENADHAHGDGKSVFTYSGGTLHTNTITVGLASVGELSVRDTETITKVLETGEHSTLAFGVDQEGRGSIEITGSQLTRLNGSIRLDYRGHRPTQGDTFPIITTEAGVSVADTVSISSDLPYDSDDSAGTQFELVVPPEAPNILFARYLGHTPGDADTDGDIDMDDFTTLAAHFGAQAGTQWKDGDFDGDADVDFTDFVVLAERYGWKRDGYDRPAE